MDMNDATIVSILSIVPKKTASKLQGRFAHMRWFKALNQWIIRWYIKSYNVNTDEMEGKPEDYDSLGSFFVRALKPESRPIVEAGVAMVLCDHLLRFRGQCGEGFLEKSR